MNLVFNRFTKLTMLTAIAVSMVSCGPPQEITDAIDSSQEYESNATALNTKFFRTVRTALENDPGADLTPYLNFRDEVVANKTDFMTQLSKCRVQEEVDAVFQKQPDYTGRNDELKATMLELINSNKVSTELKKIKGQANTIENTRKEVQETIQAFQDENGEEACAEEIEQINTYLNNGNAKLRSINTSCSGFNSKLDGKRKEIDDIHAEITKLIAERKAAYDQWAPPPPEPESPEKVLFTIETTPAVYEKLLIPLIQQYKNYTFVYVGPKTGNHCVADAQNKEGVVFHLVQPEQLNVSMDKLEQNMVDGIITFRDAFPDDGYAKFEEKAAANDSDLNAVIVSNIAYSALVVKANPQHQLNQLTTSRIATELSGSTVYIGKDGSLDKELFDIILAGENIQAESSSDPVTMGTGAANGAAIVAFNRSVQAGKDIRLARTPSDENVFFFPTVGNIAMGRYAYGASTNAVLNPATSGYEEIRNFLNFVLSTEGQNVVKSAGFISRDEYDEDNVELKRLKQLFLEKGYTIGRIITHDTFLFPKNDTRISKNPKIANRKNEFREFDSNIRSNFGHIARVLKNTTSTSGTIAVGIIGHASSEGGFSVNKPLSINRAKYAGACIEQQVPGKMLLTDGMSSEVPVDSNADESGRIRNRRATAYVLEVFEIGMKK
ncbi:MAG: OmpA family protein [Akkermansia sp.]|nr:OmpA family protein [Akkermansia sp.]